MAEKFSLGSLCKVLQILLSLGFTSPGLLLGYCATICWAHGDRRDEVDWNLRMNSARPIAACFDALVRTRET